MAHVQQKTIARALGISPGLVSRYRRLGMPVSDIESARRWKEENIAPRVSPTPPQADMQSAPLARAGSPSALDLAAERARLASAQADRIEMLNRTARKEYAPTASLEVALALVCRRIAGIMEALPVQLRRRSTSISDADLAIVEEEVARVRNLAAAIELSDADKAEIEAAGRNGEQAPLLQPAE